MKPAAPEWKIAGVSVRGFSHEEKSEPCQDAHGARTVGDGWLLAIAADGAGSTLFGGEGARIASQGILDHLGARFSGLLKVKPGRLSTPGVRKWIKEAIAATRKDLAAAAMAKGVELNQFHATIVGCLAHPKAGGVFFHIGDGAGCAVNSADPTQFVISAPENGAYAETTFFVTEDHWLEHLRFRDFGPEHDLILLMSDGVTSMALKGSMLTPQPAIPFVEPISRFLRTVDRDQGEAALTATLASDRVRDITGDDKTLVWAVKNA